jgi:hypothetical protein
MRAFSFLAIIILAVTPILWPEWRFYQGSEVLRIWRGVKHIPSLEVLSLPHIKNVGVVDCTLNIVSPVTGDQNVIRQWRERSALARVSVALAKVPNKVYPRLLRGDYISMNEVSESEGDCDRDFARLRLPCVFADIFNTLSVVGIDSRPKRTAKISSYLGPTNIEGGDRRVGRLFRKCEGTGGVFTLSIGRIPGECVSCLGLLKCERCVSVLSASRSVRVINRHLSEISKASAFNTSVKGGTERECKDKSIDKVEPISLKFYVFACFIGVAGLSLAGYGAGRRGQYLWLACGICLGNSSWLLAWNVDAIARHLASLDCRSENVGIIPVIVPELKFSDVHSPLRSIGVDAALAIGSVCPVRRSRPDRPVRANYNHWHVFLCAYSPEIVRQAGQ